MSKFWKFWCSVFAFLFLWILSLGVGSEGNDTSITFFTIFCFIIVWSIFKIYELWYFNSKYFNNILYKFEKHIENCNELNKHIEKLKDTYIGINQLDFGSAEYNDSSYWNYKRPELKNQKYAPNIYNCSRTICDNARKQPFKYICKYFGIKPEEESLCMIEKVLNNFEAAKDGVDRLSRESNRIFDLAKLEVPFLIKVFGKKQLKYRLDLPYVDFNTIYYPRFVFQYISSGGYASSTCEIVLDIQNLNKFIAYLSEVIKFKKSVAGQRALMTSSLRNKILKRDDYTCKICKNSIYSEPNLLLEVDHIIPVSRGGLTTEDNLQTLCWKCNRHKSNKVYTDDKKEKNTISVHNFYNTPIQKEMKSTDAENVFVGQPIKYFSNAKDNVDNEVNNKMEEKTMYDIGKGIYPSGQYLVGRDIPLGGYILTAKKEKNACVQLYPSYQKYKKEEDAITYDCFEDDYHISLMEENTFMVVENAEIKRI